MKIGDVLRVPAGTQVNLAAVDPRSTPGLPGTKKVRHDPKAWARLHLTEIGERLASQQERLYASAKVSGDHHSVLLILQAMDCGGKDGTTKNVAGTMNPTALRVISFGPPTPEERRHDFLWRIGRNVPLPGCVAVFNRSHYEDVLIARVRELVPQKVWEGRYEKINDFERQLADRGVALLKVMLHISYAEQRERLLERLDDPTKHWKFNPEDIDERGRWDQYQAAYEDALSRCSTSHAPWHVVPADRKWYRDWAVAGLLLETFEDMNLAYPPGDFDPAVQRARLVREKMVSPAHAAQS